MAYRLMACILMAHILMAYSVVAYRVMAYGVMAYIGLEDFGCPDRLAKHKPSKEVACSNLYRLCIGSISASPTACPLHGYGRAGTQNDRLSAVMPR